ncbi:hypothetical protein GCM10011328_23140 [Hafnia psychrotolerans]|uniref:Transposase n=1 Tax=Hafnia psychrotolerans TaxID=1477018 RepID=A0ABQ1GNI3_9GAMM|nr:hypothetical protein GCM10011328_23140 [Hafnia psychrotolerans]
MQKAKIMARGKVIFNVFNVGFNMAKSAEALFKKKNNNIERWCLLLSNSS